MTHRPEYGEGKELPRDWPIRTAEGKSKWFTRRRIYKQAIRQDTSFGNAHSRAVEDAKEAGVDHGPNKPDEGADNIEGAWLRDAFIEVNDGNKYKQEDELR